MSIGSVSRSQRFSTVLLLIFFFFVLLIQSLVAQGNAGRILGGVSDQSGAVIAGAMVTVTDVARNVSRTLTTDDSGEYNAPNLTPGTYTVRVEAKGFQVVQRENVLLEVGGDVRIDVQLQPGEITQTVTVTESVPLVETTNAVLGGTLPSDIIGQLPLNGGNFSKMLDLRPGVTVLPGGPIYGVSTNGLRGHAQVYMFDGVYASDPFLGASMINATMISGDAGTLLPVEAIDEFKVSENPRAEYGWKPGAQINVGVKSGTNSYHGTGYAYGRDSAWDARNYFIPAPNPVPPIDMQEFGGTFGGPIKRDKLFYFLVFGQQQYTLGSVNTITTPISAAGIGNATNNWLMACQAALDVGAPGSGRPGALTALSAQLTGIQVGTPIAGHPNGTCQPAMNYPGLFRINDGSNPTNIAPAVGVITIPSGLLSTNLIDSGVGKVDYHLNEKHSLNFLYFISPGTGITANGGSGASQTNRIWETDQVGRTQQFSTNWTWTPNASWVNEARVGYIRYVQNFIALDNGNPADYNFTSGNNVASTYHFYTGVTDPAYFGFPDLGITGFTATLGGRAPKYVGPNSVLSLLDHISYLRGKHAFKFGGEIIANRSSFNVTANTGGSLAFDDLADFFAGFPNGPCGIAGFPGYPASSGITSCPGGSSVSLNVGNQQRTFSFQGYAAFLQDDWRVTPRLTLTLGLRYEIDTVPVEQNNLQGNFDPGSFSGLAQVGAGITSPYNGDHNNFSPRLGIAWDVFGNGRTVLRAGGSIIYELLTLDVFNNIGNSFGQRVVPTGALLFANCGGGATPAPGTAKSSCQIPSPGNITVANYTFNNTAVTNNFAAGDIPFQWANNGTSNPLFSTTAACGDGTGALANGFVPQPCPVIYVLPNLRNAYVNSWSLGFQQSITNRMALDVSYVGNHGTKLIGGLDINQPNAATLNVPGVGTVITGGGWTAAQLAACAAKPTTTNCKPSGALEQEARPYYLEYPYLSSIDEFGNFEMSNYNALQVTMTARNYHGLTLTSGYTYAHALGENSDQGPGSGLRSAFLPINSDGNIKSQLYSNSNFDIRHHITITGTYMLPGKNGFGQMLEGWSIESTGTIQTGLPWGVADLTTDFAGTGEQTTVAAANEGYQWDFLNSSGGRGNNSDFEAIHDFVNVPPGPTGVPGIPYYPGTGNATCLKLAQSGGPLQVASLTNLGCYALGNSYLIPPAYGGYGTQPRFAWRDGGFRNWDLSVSKAYKIKELVTAQFRAEFFNVLNHPTILQGTGQGTGYNPSTASKTGFGYVTATPNASNPVFGSGGPRNIQLGLKLSF